MIMKRLRQKLFVMKHQKTYEGETIEKKVARVVENKEPITDGAPIIYTDRKDGVLPQYDVRTDKWDVAIEAMDKVNKSKVAKSEEYLKKQIEEKAKEMDDGSHQAEEN